MRNEKKEGLAQGQPENYGLNRNTKTMKRKFLITLSTMLLMSTGSMVAQSADYYYQFTDKDGNVIPDGTTIVRNDAEEDDFGDVMMGSGLYVMNTSESADYSVRIEAEVTRMDNGSLQLCFPMNCYYYSEPGSYKTEYASLPYRMLRDIQSEWIPEEHGQCVVRYTAMAVLPMGSSGIAVGGPAVTIRYVYGDTMEVHGDVNGDSTVDVADISAILSHMAGTKQYDKADVNGDGTIDVADISAVLTVMSEE